MAGEGSAGEAGPHTLGKARLTQAWPAAFHSLPQCEVNPRILSGAALRPAF